MAAAARQISQAKRFGRVARDRSNNIAGLTNGRVAIESRTARRRNVADGTEAATGGLMMRRTRM
jgi:hypothetical protein